ncbi:MAG: VWA domain-containing protein [Planctomycetota bacterium]
MNRLGTALACGLVLCCATAYAKLSSQDIKRIKKEMSEASQGKDWNKLADLVRQLAEDDKKPTWKFLLKVAESTPPEGGAVYTALADATGKMQAKGIDAEARRALAHSRVTGVRRALLHAAADRKDYAAVVDALDDSDEDVAYAAIWTLGKARAEEGVEPLIKLMEKLDAKKTGNWLELRTALSHLLGEQLQSGAEYRSLWEALKAQGGLKAAKPFDPSSVREGGGTMTLSFFGRSIESSRVVFILDTSGSMFAKDPYELPKATVEGAPPKPLNRLERAQEQLKKVINGLSEGVRVNIIAYSSPGTSQIWKKPAKEGDKPQVHPLTKENRESACKFVDGFVTSGATATDEALRLAYTVEGARAFYLLSDGAPTAPKGNTALDPEVIYKLCREEDRGRGIKVHTMGFRGASREFMQKLASLTGGTYSDIK